MTLGVNRVTLTRTQATTEHVLAAADGALRKAIFTDWKSLGLKSEPNVGDNGADPVQ